MATMLETLLQDVRTELASARAQRPPSEIRRMLADAPPVRPLDQALASTFGLIAEIKERSPSVGAMRPQNVRLAPEAYEASPIVRAVSVLTNATHFGMSIEKLAAIRHATSKPTLRKDFILEEYQIREARAFGADAILLMANVLDRARLAGFYDLARELGMEALFEVHEEPELALLPPSARIVGINSRKFRSASGFAGAHGYSEHDFSLDFSAFALAVRLPAHILKVAESGLGPLDAPRVRESFHAALVGTSLLRDPRGPAACLADFQKALAGPEITSETPG